MNPAQGVENEGLVSSSVDDEGDLRGDNDNDRHADQSGDSSGNGSDCSDDDSSDEDCSDVDPSGDEDDDDGCSDSDEEDDTGEHDALTIVRLRANEDAPWMHHYFLARRNARSSFPDAVVVTHNSGTGHIYCAGKHPGQSSYIHSCTLKDGEASDDCSFTLLFREHVRNDTLPLATSAASNVVTHNSRFVTIVDRLGTSAALLRASKRGVKCYSCTAPCSHAQQCKETELHLSEPSPEQRGNEHLVEFDDTTGEYKMPAAAKFVSSYRSKLLCPDGNVGHSMVPKEDFAKRLVASGEGTVLRPFTDTAAMSCQTCHGPTINIQWLTVGAIHTGFVAALSLPLCAHCKHPLHIGTIPCDEKADLFIGKPRELEDGTLMCWAVDMALVRTFLDNRGKITVRRLHAALCDSVARNVPQPLGTRSQPR